MRQSDRLFFVKTHDYPEDNSKAIYILRDGRASIVSFRHYLKDFTNREYSLTELIWDFVHYGSWGSHLDVWNPLNRPNTLLIKYEQLLTDPDEGIKKISDFLGLKPIRPWKNDFDYFHEINPQFFREGDTSKSVKELRKDDLDIFWLFHGDWMDTLGYTKMDNGYKYNAYLLRETVRRTYRRIEADYYSLKVERNKLRAERDRLRTERKRPYL